MEIKDVGFVSSARVIESLRQQQKKRPLTMTDDEWEDLDVKALSKIRLCLVYDVLFNIVGEKSTVSLWGKLESLYMTKSLTK